MSFFLLAASAFSRGPGLYAAKPPITALKLLAN
jgi:hypothetical protein